MIPASDTWTYAGILLEDGTIKMKGEGLGVSKPLLIRIPMSKPMSRTNKKPRFI